jgi:hypothetical protein
LVHRRIADDDYGVRQGRREVKSVAECPAQASRLFWLGSASAEAEPKAKAESPSSPSAKKHAGRSFGWWPMAGADLF